MFGTATNPPLVKLATIPLRATGEVTRQDYWVECRGSLDTDNVCSRSERDLENWRALHVLAN